jgi:hypothetical protein
MSTGSTPVELKATGMRFFSQGDESAFFAWLDKLPIVERYEGRGSTLYLLVRSEAVDESGLRELLALFTRYRIGLRQLLALDREEFADWFRNEKAYRYEEIFG